MLEDKTTDFIKDSIPDQKLIFNQQAFPDVNPEITLYTLIDKLASETLSKDEFWVLRLYWDYELMEAANIVDDELQEYKKLE